jgi:hypothetical protein
MITLPAAIKPSDRTVLLDLHFKLGNPSPDDEAVIQAELPIDWSTEATDEEHRVYILDKYARRRAIVFYNPDKSSSEPRATIELLCRYRLEIVPGQYDSDIGGTVAIRIVDYGLIVVDPRYFDLELGNRRTLYITWEHSYSGNKNSTNYEHALSEAKQEAETVLRRPFNLFYIDSPMHYWDW